MARENGGCARRKGSFDGHKQPPKWRAQPRTQPQIAVFVSEVVVIAKVTQIHYFRVFRRNYFVCVHRNTAVSTLRSSLRLHLSVDTTSKTQPQKGYPRASPPEGG